MITSNQRQIVSVIIFGYLCVPMLGAEPNWPPVTLEFKRSHPIRFHPAEPPPIMPTHASNVSVWWYHVPPDTPNGVDLLRTPVGKSLSDLQRGIVEATPSSWVYVDDDRHWGSTLGDFRRGRINYSVFAVSEADARKMAQALVEFLTREGKESVLRAKKDHIEKLLGMQRRLMANIATGKEKVEAKNAERETVMVVPGPAF